MTVVDWTTLLAHREVETLLALAVEEDLGPGDLTTRGVFEGPVTARGAIVARIATVACGLPLAQALFRRFDGELVTTPMVDEGAWVDPGTTLLEVHGDIRPMLSAERCGLNFLMRLCGIAHGARQAAERVPEGCRAQIFDTRKTTPGWRRLEKAAVRTGGAANHRVGLFDAVLIKDNHIAAAGSIAQAIAGTRAKSPEGTVIEVEIDRLDQLDEALSASPDIVLLDNFSLDDLRIAVERTGGRAELEASGGMTLERIPEVARTGVDRISLGALTHTVVPADLGLDLMEDPRP